MATSIPAFHVSTKSKAKGDGKVTILSRQDASSSGVFEIKISVEFDPAVHDYPTGGFVIKTDLSDSINSTYESTTIELINSYGKHNPTIYLTGQCKADIREKGLRYWLMIANNKERNQKGTPDIVGFVIHDRDGNRISYGTGPLDGDIEVEPNN
jgi:hypothetical protein